MGLIRTIISFEEDQYYALKNEAAKKRQSLSSVVREIVHESRGKKARSKEEVEEFMARIRKHAKESAKYLKGWDSLKALREIRDES